MQDLMALAVSLAVPPVVSWLKDGGWPDWAKVLLALSVSAVAAGALVAMHGSLNLRAVGTSTAIIFTGATFCYKTWFQRSRINARLERNNNGF